MKRKIPAGARPPVFALNVAGFAGGVRNKGTQLFECSPPLRSIADAGKTFAARATCINGRASKRYCRKPKSKICATNLAAGRVDKYTQLAFVVAPEQLFTGVRVVVAFGLLMSTNVGPPADENRTKKELSVRFVRLRVTAIQQTSR
jgi:hypothetical protein